MFYLCANKVIYIIFTILTSCFQILKPSDKKAKYQYNNMKSARPITPPRNSANKTLQDDFQHIKLT